MIQNDTLQYKISDLHQLSKCMSNNSRDLKIAVADFLHDDRLSGTRVSVVHTEFGVLFSYIFNIDGTLITQQNGEEAPEIGYTQLMEELRKFGFIVEYESEDTLPLDVIQYLFEILKLGFDKLRVLPVQKQDKSVSTVVVAFMSGSNPKWLHNTYEATQGELTAALVTGTAINLSAVSETRKYDWSWLDFVANIQDVILNNPSQLKYLGELLWRQI